MPGDKPSVGIFAYIDAVTGAEAIADRVSAECKAKVAIRRDEIRKAEEEIEYPLLDLCLFRGTVEDRCPLRDTVVGTEFIETEFLDDAEFYCEACEYGWAREFRIELGRIRPSEVVDE